MWRFIIKFGTAAGLFFTFWFLVLIFGNARVMLMIRDLEHATHLMPVFWLILIVGPILGYFSAALFWYLHARFQKKNESMPMPESILREPRKGRFVLTIGTRLSLYFLLWTLYSNVTQVGIVTVTNPDHFGRLLSRCLLIIFAGTIMGYVSAAVAWCFNKRLQRHVRDDAWYSGLLKEPVMWRFLVKIGTIASIVCTVVILYASLTLIGMSVLARNPEQRTPIMPGLLSTTLFGLIACYFSAVLIWYARKRLIRFNMSKTAHG